MVGVAGVGAGAGEGVGGEEEFGVVGGGEVGGGDHADVGPNYVAGEAGAEDVGGDGAAVGHKLVREGAAEAVGGGGEAGAGPGEGDDAAVGGEAAEVVEPGLGGAAVFAFVDAVVSVGGVVEDPVGAGHTVDGAEEVGVDGEADGVAEGAVVEEGGAGVEEGAEAAVFAEGDAEVVVAKDGNGAEAVVAGFWGGDGEGPEKGDGAGGGCSGVGVGGVGEGGGGGLRGGGGWGGGGGGGGGGGCGRRGGGRCQSC